MHRNTLPFPGCVFDGKKSLNGHFSTSVPGRPVAQVGYGATNRRRLSCRQVTQVLVGLLQRFDLLAVEADLRGRYLNGHRPRPGETYVEGTFVRSSDLRQCLAQVGRDAFIEIFLKY